MTVPSFFVHEEHLIERLCEQFDQGNTKLQEDNACIHTVMQELRNQVQVKSSDHSAFHRFLVSTSRHSGIDALGDGPDSYACFVAACHYYFGF